MYELKCTVEHDFFWISQGKVATVYR